MALAILFETNIGMGIADTFKIYCLLLTLVKSFSAMMMFVL